MSEPVKNILLFMGSLVFLYVLFRYVLPVIFQIVGFILGVVLYVAAGALIVLGIIWFFSFLMGRMKNS